MRLKSLVLLLGVGVLCFLISTFFYEMATIMLYVQLVLLMVGMVLLSLGLILVGLSIASFVLSRISPRPRIKVVRVKVPIKPKVRRKKLAKP
jgi:hypothetical protein